MSPPASAAAASEGGSSTPVPPEEEAEGAREEKLSQTCMKQLVEEREAAASRDGAVLAGVSSVAMSRDFSGELGFMN
ncbi:hypothetical protein TURU_062187 [Turdus rufiventris]|nr:hypothetical protein TURU_062187 [Turdus rufiventris]